MRSTLLFAFNGERIVGRASLRHLLDDFLLRMGGHIGYVVVPEFSRQGHATTILPSPSIRPRQARSGAGDM
jgi:predicted acetyltransferase